MKLLTLCFTLVVDVALFYIMCCYGASVGCVAAFDSLVPTDFLTDPPAELLFFPDFLLKDYLSCWVVFAPPPVLLVTVLAPDFRTDALILLC